MAVDTGKTPQQILTDSMSTMLPKYEVLFAQHSPVLGKILTGGNVKDHTDKTPYMEFRIVDEKGSGQVVQIVTTNEVFPYTQAEIADKGYTFATRDLYTWSVPIPEMIQANTPEGIEHLHKMYPEINFMHFTQKLIRQFLIASGEMPGFCTLDGSATYNPNGTAVDGVFEALAGPSQNNTVFGVGKPSATINPKTNWYHQYGHVTSMSSLTDGEFKILEPYTIASAKGQPMMGPVDIMVADLLSVLTYIAIKGTEVIQQGTLKGSGGSENLARDGIKYQGATLYADLFLDSANATVVANAGMCYGLKTETWHFWRRAEPSVDGNIKQQNKGKLFTLRGPIRVPNQDKYAWEYVFDGQVFCTFLPANFLVTGMQNA